MLQEVSSFPSPSFVRQEIKDNPNDWVPLEQEKGIKFAYTHSRVQFFVEPATDISQCKGVAQGFLSPDIGAVSYLGNDKTLNTTIWLTRPFEEPVPSNRGLSSPFVNDSSLSQPWFRVDVLHAVNMTLNELVYNENNFLRPGNVTIVGPNRTMIANNDAYKEILAYKGANGEICKDCKVMQILTHKDDRFYIFSYIADINGKYGESLKLVQAMIDSTQLDIGPIGSRANLTRNFLSYENPLLRLKLNYPNNWVKIEGFVSNFFNFKPYGSDYIGGVAFVFPVSGPLLLYKDYTMFVDVNPTYKSGKVAPYVIRIRWDWANQFWTKTIEEWSSNGQYRVLNKTANYKGFYELGKGYALLNFDLGMANFPNKYTIFWSTLDQFVKDGRLCVLRDITFPVTIPPPQYSISASPNYTKLEPSSEKDIKLLIRSLTDLDSHIMFSNGSNDDVKLNFIPKQLDIPALGEANVDVHVNVPSATNPDFQETVRINAKISFPPITATDVIKGVTHQFINGREISIFTNNSASPTIMANSGITLAVHALTPEERLNNFYSGWISPLTGFLTFLAGVATVITPLIIRKTNKERARLRKQNAS